jgi:hypothetical protein
MAQVRTLIAKNLGLFTLWILTQSFELPGIGDGLFAS